MEENILFVLPKYIVEDLIKEYGLGCVMSWQQDALRKNKEEEKVNLNLDKKFDMPF